MIDTKHHQNAPKMSIRYVIVVGFIFLGLVFSSQADAKKLRVGHIFPADSEAHKMLQEYAQAVNEKTKGEIDIDIFPAGQLGDWIEQFEMISKGTLDMGLMPYAFPFDPRLELAYVPGLVSSWEEASKAYGPDGWITNVMNELLGSVRMKPLGFYFVGMMGFGNTKHPVRVPSDCEDLKVRVVLRSDTAFWQKAKAVTVNVPFAELFTALQTGLVDGQGQNTAMTTYQSFRDVTPYWTQANYVFETMALVVSKKAWEKIKPEDEKIMQEVAMNVIKKYNIQAEKTEQEFLQKFRDMGTEVIILNEEERKAWQDLGRSTWKQLEGYLSEPIMKMCYEAIGM